MDLTKRSKNSGRCSLFLFVLLIAACQPHAQNKKQVVFAGPIMGTQYRITAVLNPEVNVLELEKSILAAMQAVNQSMSNYIDDSELNQLNQAPSGRAIQLSAGLAEVLNMALSISALSEGAFDITLAPVIDLWGFGPNGSITQKPTAQTIDSLKDSIGYRHIELEEQVLRKKTDNLSIDLSAIAKGYAVDQVVIAIRNHGILDYLVNIGGELKAAGVNIDREIWRVGIEKPHILGGVQKIVSLDNNAIATSGDYRNFHLIDGQQYSHTIDPKTLSPVFHKLALVSVIHESASMADGLATAMMAMGEEHALDFANKHGLSAYFMVRGAQQGEFVEVKSDKFNLNLQ